MNPNYLEESRAMVARQGPALDLTADELLSRQAGDIG